MSMYKLLILAVCITEALLQTPPCEKNTNCGDCILDSNVCVWCAADNLKDSRCVLDIKATDNWCSKPFFRPSATVQEGPFTKDENIKPTKYKLKLLPGQAVNFTFSADTSAINYPVDVYFVVDAFYSMERAAIKKLTETIIDELKRTTEDITLGLGTFIDKNISQFVDSYSYNCYSFKHHQSLTRNHTEFQKALETYPPGRNGARADSGFDALAQAISCKHFGWREESLKVVLYRTNFIFHFEGEGKQAGINEPYDGKCYTDANGIYTKELEMDYPSVDMINKLATENDVNILFTFTDQNSFRLEHIKEQLPRFTNISGSEVVYLSEFENGVFGSKLKAITERINTKLNPRVQHKENAGEDFKITFNPDCNQDTNACKFVQDMPLKFTASITLLQYKGVDNYSLDIAVPGVTNKLTVDIEIIKGCECESKTEINSQYFVGEARQCGICINKEKSKSIWPIISREPLPYRHWRRTVKLEEIEEASDIQPLGHLTTN